MKNCIGRLNEEVHEVLFLVHLMPLEIYHDPLTEKKRYYKNILQEKTKMTIKIEPIRGHDLYDVA